jgi:WD40 repeat protein
MTSGRVALIGSASHELRASFEASTDRVSALAFSHDGARLATSSAEPVVRVWDVGGALTTAQPAPPARRKKKAVGSRSR